MSSPCACDRERGRRTGGASHSPPPARAGRSTSVGGAAGGLVVVVAPPFTVVVDCRRVEPHCRRARRRRLHDGLQATRIGAHRGDTAGGQRERGGRPGNGQDTGDQVAMGNPATLSRHVHSAEPQREVAVEDLLVLRVGDGHVVRGLPLDGRLVAAPERVQRPRPGLVGVGQVEVAELVGQAAEQAAIGGDERQLPAGRRPAAPWRSCSRRAPRWPVRCRRRGPSGRPRRRPGGASSSSSAGVRSGRSSRSQIELFASTACARCQASVGAATGVSALGSSAGSASPVSISDFIESSTHAQPSLTFAQVFGLLARSPCTRRTRVRPSPTGSISHVTRLGGSSDIAASYSTRQVCTSRRGGSISSITPSTAGRPAATTLVRYGLPASYGASGAVPWK